MGEFDRPGTLELLDVQGPTDRSTLHRLRWQPHRAGPDLTVLDVELTLQLANPRGLQPNPTRNVALRFSAPEDRPTLARALPDTTRGPALVVLARTRSVRAERDLRAIFECKMRQAQRVRRPP